MPDWLNFQKFIGIAAFVLLCVRLWRAWRSRRARLSREHERERHSQPTEH